MRKTISKQSELSKVRDTVESVYVAIILAFVLRAFMVEAFVIPTGSMANALYGEHYELECPACHYTYAHGRSQNPRRMERVVRGLGTVPSRARCPNCSFAYRDGAPARPVMPSGGDRVLVLKYIYDFSPPKPWDVVVFKNPQNNRENYIKRLIGLPGETIQIVRGDIFYKDGEHQAWRVRRKPQAAQEAMWQNVFTNDDQPDRAMLRAEGIAGPEWKPLGSGGPWDTSKFGRRVFAYAGGQASELIFHPGPTAFRPTNGYNAPEDEQHGGNMDMLRDICTDWKLSMVLMPGKSDAFRFNMTFTSFEERFRAEFRSSGEVLLMYQPREANPADDKAWILWGRKNVGPFERGKGRKVAFSVVDFRASLWVDGKVILRSTEEQYNHGYAKAWARATLKDRLDVVETNIERLLAGTETMETKSRLAKARAARADLRKQWRWYQTPSVKISAAGGPVELWHVKLQRDVYYTSPILRDIEGLRSGGGLGRQYDYVRKMLNAPADSNGPNSWKKNAYGDYLGWGTTGNPIVLREHPENHDLDEYFCLGDNSPESFDGRGWTAAAPSLRLYDKNGKFQYQLGTVPRYNILGRAMFVYWPAGFRLPILNWSIVPNVGRMRLIK
jgi:signal peptidase I